MMEINDGNVMFGNFRHKRIGSTTGTLSSSTCKSWWQFPGSAHGQSPSNSRHFCAFVSRTCKLKDLTGIWCAGPDECRTIWECFEFQLISCPRKKTLTLSHQLSSAFWRLSAEPVRWSLWSGTAAEDVLRTDVSTDVSVREYGMIHSSIHHTS